MTHILIFFLKKTCFDVPFYIIHEWWTKLLTTRNGHDQSGWSPIGCEGFHTNLNIPSPLPTT